MRGRSPLREAAAILAVCLGLGLAAYVAQRLLVPRSPVPTDLAGRLDEGVGSLIREQVLAQQKVVAAPAPQEGLDRIVERLRGALPEPRPVVHVILLQSPEINAFTIPGDTIFVDSGLLRSLDSADQMAGVLGHELSHAVNRDPLTMLARRLGVAVLLSAVSGGQGGSVLANAAQTLIDMRYGRQAEDRADAFSVRLLARAGIPPGSLADALERIRDSAPREPAFMKYLDPHSPITQRIARARALARREAYTPRPLGVDWAALVAALPGR